MSVIWQRPVLPSIDARTARWLVMLNTQRARSRPALLCDLRQLGDTALLDQWCQPDLAARLTALLLQPGKRRHLARPPHRPPLPQGQRP